MYDLSTTLNLGKPSTESLQTLQKSSWLSQYGIRTQLYLYGVNIDRTHELISLTTHRSCLLYTSDAADDYLEV